MFALNLGIGGFDRFLGVQKLGDLRGMSKFCPAHHCSTAQRIPDLLVSLVQRRFVGMF